MADFAADNENFLREFMDLEHGPPSHDAFSRLFQKLDPEPFAVNSEALRRSFSRASGTSLLHVANAFAPDFGLVLGQAAVDGKSNEIWALLDLKGAVIAADAMHSNAAERIIGKGGTCVLAPRTAKDRIWTPQYSQDT